MLALQGIIHGSDRSRSRNILGREELARPFGNDEMGESIYFYYSSHFPNLALK